MQKPFSKFLNSEATNGSYSVNMINHSYVGVLARHYRTLNEMTCAKPLVVNDVFRNVSSGFKMQSLFFLLSHPDPQ